MPPRRGRGRRGATEPEDRVDRIERILEGLVQVVHEVHNNNNHDDAPQQPAMPMPGAGAMPCTTIKQFQQLRPPTFYGTPDPMAAESWLLGIERVFEVLPCTDEQKVKPLEPLWIWPRFLEVFNEEYFPEMIRDQKIQEFLNLKQGDMIVVEYNAKFMELSRYAPHIVSTESRKARRFEAGLRWNIKNKVEILRLPTHQEVLHAALIAEESLKEMSQFRENRKKRIGGNMNRGQGSKRQSSGSSSGNSSAQQRKIASQGSSGFNELPTCPICQKKHRGKCRMGTRACYGCGQEGHQIRDCPMRNRIQGAGTSTSASVPKTPAERRNNQPRQGRAFALVPGNTPLPHQLLSLEYELSVSLPSGDTMSCDRVYSSCEIRVNDVPMYVDLIPLEIHGFDVILGMDWLSSYRALIDCELKRVVFHSFAHSGLIFEGVGVVPPPYLISSMKANRLIRKGSQAFLCSVIDTHASPPSLEDIHVVREFPDVFPDELPGSLVDREIEFYIDLNPGTRPISKAPYRMSPLELKELKDDRAKSDQEITVNGDPELPNLTVELAEMAQILADNKEVRATKVHTIRWKVQPKIPHKPCQVDDGPLEPHGCLDVPAPKGIGSHLTLRKGKNESIGSYSKCYWETYNEIEECSKELAAESYKLGMTPRERLWENLTFNPPTDLRDLMSQVEMFARMEDDVKQAEKATGTTTRGKGEIQMIKQMHEVLSVQSPAKKPGQTTSKPRSIMLTKADLERVQHPHSDPLGQTWKEKLRPIETGAISNGAIVIGGRRALELGRNLTMSDQEITVGGDPDLCQRTEGNLHNRVFSNSPIPVIRRLQHGDVLPTAPQEHGWVSHLTDTVAGASSFGGRSHCFYAAVKALLSYRLVPSLSTTIRPP
ncbi:hypothetical protein Acr_10g0008470 [Actinidia rufa]|uniref:CCHC-type domain-containing protein n=1 Tax=Actinidia rufa TaxID=165716 RepID=A0A7J0F9T3_9ERIC|nr:hypothetical protein Acr_10g0008470 [Actinidia rufa]